MNPIIPMPRHYDRFKRLFNEEAATKDEFDRAKADYLAVKNRLSAFDARIKAVDEEIKALNNELRYLVIKSPVSGWVTKRTVDPGSFVGPGAHLFDIDSKEEGFWFVASLNESLLNKVREGDEVFLSIEQAAGLKVLRISRVIPKVDVHTHTFKVKLDLPGNNLKSGMYGKIWIRTGEKKGLIVPLEAVVKRGGIKGVYVVDKDGQIHWRVVTVGELYLRGSKGLFPWSEELEPSGNQFEQVALISSGIVPGAKIIVSNLFEVREGMSLE
ncbi:Efflux transporter, RND family, MFP subunit, AcrA/E family [Dissulfuribacter thermophilus]|uniref:Efflux transporter, RND family, MFP subunit, AcrA/E family n=1 Tax=Dissulfuribacter thermophilus TaxID=1156395 RepID=A0A1B9F979_9BACT|nr:efflux RND transporter periplasmic adaptor subunit [Dissulfuribacter thermophilus]OCC16424.1 Efflux transporter, RND family, MFP subunit, AcrA/E family [Dissulfuribacter thermophilus]